MNEAAAASKALEDVANNQVIMMELVLYAIISIVLILLMDLWAGKVIGNKQSMEYKVLRIPQQRPQLRRRDPQRLDRLWGAVRHRVVLLPD